MSLQLDNPGLVFWRKSSARNRHFSDAYIQTAIDAGNQYAAAHACVNVTEGCRTAIALFYVRFCYSDDMADKKLLMDAIDMLLGVGHADRP